MRPSNTLTMFSLNLFRLSQSSHETQPMRPSHGNLLLCMRYAEPQTKYFFAEMRHSKYRSKIISSFYHFIRNGFLRFITSFEMVFAFSISFILFSFYFEIYSGGNIRHHKDHSIPISSSCIVYFPRLSLAYSAEWTPNKLLFSAHSKLNFFSFARKQQGKVSQLHLASCSLSEILSTQTRLHL